MNILKMLYCLIFGHKSSLFPGINVPLTLTWMYPKAEEAPPTPLAIPNGSGAGVFGMGVLYNSVPAAHGPSYNVDLCQRCLALYVSPPPPVCANCHAIERLHTEGFCDTPCESCGKPREVHLEGKCPFEASNYKGARWAKSTRSACP